MKDFKARLKGYLIAGVLVLLPSVITLNIFLFVFNKVGRLFRIYLTPFFKYIGIQDPPFIIFSSLGFLIIIIVTAFAGMIARNYVGKKIVYYGELLVARIPILSKIYLAAKQLLEAFAFKEKDAFRQLVMVEYPRKGIFSLGFLTAKTQGHFQHAHDEELVNLFVPTTPNPTSGMLIIVPKKDIIPIDITVEDGLKFIVSGGIVFHNRDKDSSDKNQYEKQDPV